MIHPQFEFVLSAVRTALNLPGLQPADDGTCQLVVDDEIVVNLGWMEAQAQVVWFAPVGSLKGAADRSRALADLLRANLFWQETGGATLALAKDDDTVVLAYQTPAHNITGEEVLAVLQWFIDMTAAWVDKFDALVRPPEEAAAPGMGSFTLGAFASGMLRG
ncbi:type III secretion system chaperone [Acidovorax sp. Leaf78]|uniref:type III secretion system chaperone n=1 Tax=unclassified Acidovorax TaxID=2684926 RepID=UPI0006F9A21B|nr:type III secretion system chaperone [Acidovorax sp. Leaf78]KQO14307.1 hypothetical protein ASF16_18830 [Acidovorax sp. Leaf78]RYF56167.1 MAG: CesT family type III secretion system chaperone [Comamonadaceae bacterium]